jgi:hypothetical protein
MLKIGSDITSAKWATNHRRPASDSCCEPCARQSLPCGGTTPEPLRDPTRATPRCLVFRMVPCCLPQPKMHSIIARRYCDMPLCLSQIKSGHICDAVRQGPDSKQCALPSHQCAIRATPCPRKGARASHYSNSYTIGAHGEDAVRRTQQRGQGTPVGSSRRDQTTRIPAPTCYSDLGRSPCARGSSCGFRYSSPSGPIAVTCVTYSPDGAQARGP